MSLYKFDPASFTVEEKIVYCDLKEIIKKGKPQNDLFFHLTHSGDFDKMLMLEWLRKGRKGMKDDELTELVNNPVLTNTNDGLLQLMGAAMLALDVYTEDEIVAVLCAQRKFRQNGKIDGDIE